MVHKDLETNRECEVPVDMTVNEDENTPGTRVSSNRITLSRWYKLFLRGYVEENGIRPVPPEERTETQHSNLFTVFFTGLLCILPIPTGALGTVLFGLGLRDVSLIIIFNIVTCLPPAFISLGGYKTGMRQMVQARYYFGLYLVAIPLLLNAGTITGFTVVGSIVSGQAIAAVNKEANISINVGIAIAVGCGGKHLVNQADHEPATVKNVVGYGSLMAGYFMTFGGTVSDFTVYHTPEESKRKVFAYVYLGFLIPSTPLLILGAAIGGAIPNVDSWQTAWIDYGLGGVMAEMLKPAGGFGKFVLVVMGLSIVGNMLLSYYSVALCLQMLIPVFTKVPRFVFVIVTLAIMVPMSIYAAAQWQTSLVNFLSMIGYWAGCFDAVIIEELVVFRNRDYGLLDPEIWDQGRKLPTGLAAIGASIISLGLVVPSMNTPWFTGPIGAKIGDIGFESAFLVTGIAYYPLRTLEIKLMGRV
ncbi:hypothetical protein HYE67_003322 [Fusarium culmorum]|uniref:Purine-cytosine permease fcyB n=1 Tax=Fusarium culmorum TaxID=5516 RepID=A0A7S8HTK8_FUSCU|nr:hypothetical protein HYE67_003322 [Fusarium culmorum]